MPVEAQDFMNKLVTRLFLARVGLRLPLQAAVAGDASPDQALAGEAMNVGRVLGVRAAARFGT